MKNTNNLKVIIDNYQRSKEEVIELQQKLNNSQLKNIKFELEDMRNLNHKM